MRSVLILFLIMPFWGVAQHFTKQDTLRGSDTAFRNFWDVKKYELTVEPDAVTKSVKGHNKIFFEITKDVENPTFQIDLRQPMAYHNFKAKFKYTEVKRDGDFIFIKTKQHFRKGQYLSMEMDYDGCPQIAENTPWDGGWVFAKDGKGRPWMSVAQEDKGLSLWLPCKDIWRDEPENGITMTVITPKDMVGIGNGRLISTKSLGNKKHYKWRVINPINDYSIVPSVGYYAHFSDVFNGEKGKLNLDYWVLDYNLEKARKQFKQVNSMLEAFEYWFGAYPFYEDSYKVVDEPYLGMEHQSNIAYGNGYQNGYAGKDWSDSGVGLKWDFIIVHESGHEWFANNITAKDRADMWIHESFTCYSETLFTQYVFGKAEAEKYIIGIRKNIQNDKPIIGHYGVDNEGSGDMYWKGASMVHTIRTVINDDNKFRTILRGLNKTFYHKTVTSDEVESYINEHSGIDFSTVFRQYLTTTKVPILEYQQNGNVLRYRWRDVVKGFDLPLRINDGAEVIIPAEQWQETTLKSSTPVNFDINYYVHYQKLDSILR